MGERAQNLTEMIHIETREFVKNFKNQYQAQRQQYYHRVYQQLADCYTTHITEQAASQLSSEAMLAYYQCYKQTLRKAKNNNQKLYTEGLTYDKKLKHCFEIKSTFSKSAADFEEDRRECLTDYRDKYVALYENFFRENVPASLDQVAAPTVEAAK